MKEHGYMVSDMKNKDINMKNEFLKDIFDSFCTEDDFVSAENYGGGHINSTYRVCGKKGSYTLQKINTDIFKCPHDVMKNISGVTSHIEKKLVDMGIDPSRRRLDVIYGKNGEPYVENEHGSYRMFRFIDGVKTYSVIEDSGVFYKAARAFGEFQKMLADYPSEKLYETIPNFHNTPVRYADFCRAVDADCCGRAADVKKEIEYIHRYSEFYGIVTDSIADGRVPIRVTHNDTKLDNILFDNETDDAICIIDLDTVMPGSMLYDYGDSLRVGTNSRAEDSLDVEGVRFRTEFFRAFTEGYVEELGDVMIEREFELLSYAGRLMTLECAMRFLADHISGDTYFKISRPNQNLDRARVGIALAEDMRKNEDAMKSIVDEIRIKYKCK